MFWVRYTLATSIICITKSEMCRVMYVWGHALAPDPLDVHIRTRLKARSALFLTLHNNIYSDAFELLCK